MENNINTDTIVPTDLKVVEPTIPNNITSPLKTTNTRKSKKSLEKHNKTKTVLLKDKDLFSSEHNINKDLNAIMKNTKPINFGSKAVKALLKLYYIYLHNKYGSSCGLITNEILINVDRTELDLGYSNIDKLFDRESLEHVIKCLHNSLMDNNNEQNLIFNVRLKMPINDIPDYYNLLIFNTKTRKVYHIDPNGKYAPYNTLSFNNLFSSNNNKTLNNTVQDAIESIIYIINNTLGILKNESIFVLDKDFNKMPIFQEIDINNINSKINKVINNLNIIESPVIEDDNFDEIWLMLFTELILKYKNSSPEEIYNNILTHINLNSGINKAGYLRKLMLGYINYCFNRVLKIYNIIYNKKFTSADINKEISKNVYRIFGVIETFSYATVIENFKNNALLIAKYEEYRKQNPSKSINNFISYMNAQINTFFPNLKEKMNEYNILVNELSEQNKNHDNNIKKKNELKLKIKLIKDKILQNKSLQNKNELITKLEHDITQAEIELELLSNKGREILYYISSLNQKIESHNHFLNQRKSFIESIHSFKSYNIKKARRNVSLANKTMNIEAESIKSVSPEK